jgi:hypothetical protein
MGAVSNVTEYSNAVTVDGVLAALAAPAFVKGAVGLNSIYREDIPRGQNTNAKKFSKKGSLTAATLAQSTALAIGSDGELTDTSVTATAAKCALVSGLSVEASTFTSLDQQRLVDEHGAGIGRFVSNDIIGMAAGLSVVQTATNYLSVDDLFTAQFSIFNSNCPNQEVPLHAILGPQAIRAIRKEMYQTGAVAWSNPQMLSVLFNLPSAGGFMGNLIGLGDVYGTTGFATTGGDDQQMLIHPQWCLAGIFDTAPNMIPTMIGGSGFYLELASYYLYDVIEWNDLAGVQIRSDT